MLVGEQPGNDEDLVGRPFIGPAGKLLRELLLEAGITAAHVFITNAVKHFFYELRGKRRIHKTPLQRHVAACHVWLEQELASVRPTVIVALGATALAALTGRKLSIAAARGADLRHDAFGHTHRCHVSPVGSVARAGSRGSRKTTRCVAGGSQASRTNCCEGSER